MFVSSEFRLKCFDFFFQWLDLIVREVDGIFEVCGLVVVNDSQGGGVCGGVMGENEFTSRVLVQSKHLRGSEQGILTQFLPHFWDHGLIDELIIWTFRLNTQLDQQNDCERYSFKLPFRGKSETVLAKTLWPLTFEKNTTISTTPVERGMPKQ